jgi:8-oxo-dGTP pyrophosphatase MutT (NUDIX family)
VERFELTAAAVLWRGDEILVMKRAGGFSSGGWFFPGGHLEAGERPVEACVREVREEAGIELDPATVDLVDVMTMDMADGIAHCLIYNASCSRETECVLNEEHLTARWLTPERYVERFLDASMLRTKGIPESAIALAQEVERVLRSAVERRTAGRHGST